MKALIISMHYLDENLGGPNCSKAFVKALASIFPGSTFVYPEHDDHVTDTSLLDDCDVRLVPCVERRSRVKRLLDMYRGTLHRFTPYVKQLLLDHHYDVAFLSSSFVASSGVLELLQSARCPIVTLHHNVERDYLKDNPQSILFRYPYNHFFLKAEEKAVRASVLNLTLTQSDNRYFTATFPDRKHTFKVLGTFEYHQQHITPPADSRDHTFVISGSLAAAQTEVAVLKFLADYMPILNDTCPDARLIVTGRNPSPALRQACAAHSNITLVPNPEDIMQVVGQGSYYLAPIYTGSGLKLRVMDPLRLGMPVLAHEVSSRGYEGIMDDGCMLSYNDPTTFEQGLRQLLSLNLTRHDVTRSYQRHFSFEAGKSRLAGMLRSLVNNGTPKRIGIVTWYGSANYGTSLQAYALQQAINTMGHDAYLVPHNSGGTLKGWLRWTRAHLRRAPQHTTKLQRFIANKYNIPQVYTKGQFDSMVRHTDVFVTGSDQIWNTYYCYDPFYFLDFAGDKKRVAYASSIGTTSIRDEVAASVRTLLDRFACIGVREQTAVSMLHSMLPHKDIRQVLDPTFLLTGDEWREFAAEAEIAKRPTAPYIFCYLIGARDNYARQVHDVARRMCCTDIIVIPPAERPDYTIPGATTYTQASPVEFVYLLAHASMVVTDSFHATALSINMHVPFVEFMRFDNDDLKSQNSRIFDVLNHYRLSDRIYSQANVPTLPIDYSAVQQILDNDRRLSIAYLSNALYN